MGAQAPLSLAPALPAPTPAPAVRYFAHLRHVRKPTPGTDSDDEGVTSFVARTPGLPPLSHPRERCRLH
jgi:hypothetical protein